MLAKGVTIQERVQQAEVEGLRKLLKEAQSALKSTKEWISKFVDDIVVASVHHFEEVEGGWLSSTLISI